jgi:hypothetical protein
LTSHFPRLCHRPRQVATSIDAWKLPVRSLRARQHRTLSSDRYRRSHACRCRLRRCRRSPSSKSAVEVPIALLCNPLMSTWMRAHDNVGGRRGGVDDGTTTSGGIVRTSRLGSGGPRGPGRSWWGGGRSHRFIYQGVWAALVSLGFWGWGKERLNWARGVALALLGPARWEGAALISLSLFRIWGPGRRLREGRTGGRDPTINIRYI